jgi:hypothetical protein
MRNFQEMELGKVRLRRRGTLPSIARVRSIAERTLLTQAAAAQADGRLAGQVPLLAVGVFQNDVTLNAQWTVGADGNMDWF